MVQKETNCELYSRLLFTQKLGYPLFQPELSTDFSAERQRRGIEIGDVGVVLSDGSFDPLFNICYGATDKIMNRHGVPKNFRKLDISAGEIRHRSPLYHRGKHIFSKTLNQTSTAVNASVNLTVPVDLGAGASFEWSGKSKHLAILFLPDGASSQELRSLETFENYAREHAENWYKFVKRNIKMFIGGNDLYLVTEVIKAKSWSIAVRQRDETGRQIQLQLTAAQLGSAGFSRVCDGDGENAWQDSGPKRRSSSLPVSDSSSKDFPDNQTPFFAGFKVRLRLGPGLANEPAWIKRHGAKWEQVRADKPESGFKAFARTLESGFTAFVRTLLNLVRCRGDSSVEEQHENGGGSALENSVKTELSAVINHPGDAINEHLLHNDPSATVAITHDIVWAAILDETDVEIPKIDDLIKRIEKQFTAVKSKRTGCVSFANRDRSYAPRPLMDVHPDLLREQSNEDDLASDQTCDHLTPQSPQQNVDPHPEPDSDNEIPFVTALEQPKDPVTDSAVQPSRSPSPDSVRIIHDLADNANKLGEYVQHALDVDPNSKRFSQSPEVGEIQKVVRGSKSIVERYGVRAAKQGENSGARQPDVQSDAEVRESHGQSMLGTSPQENLRDSGDNQVKMALDAHGAVDSEREETLHLKSKDRHAEANVANADELENQVYDPNASRAPPLLELFRASWERRPAPVTTSSAQPTEATTADDSRQPEAAELE